jgi:hypothetical protein
VGLPTRHRAIIHSALAALVAGALAHCSWEEARELAQRARTTAQHRLALPSPVQAPVHDCGHESGCICRGATQVHAIDVAHLKATPVDLLTLELCNRPLCSAYDDSAAAGVSFIDHDFSAPPISGRQLRALLASFVI